MLIVNYPSKPSLEGKSFSQVIFKIFARFPVQQKYLKVRFNCAFKNIKTSFEFKFLHLLNCKPSPLNDLLSPNFAAGHVNDDQYLSSS